MNKIIRIVFIEINVTFCLFFFLRIQTVILINNKQISRLSNK